MPTDSQKDPKKPFPRGILILFFSILMLMFFATNNYSTNKIAAVSSSYQLEHLVNLELIAMDKSRKVSINDRLVTFSGRFKKKREIESQSKFDYLDLLQQRHQLAAGQAETVRSAKRAKSKVLLSADFFLNMMGRDRNELERDGYLLDAGADDVLKTFPPLILRSLSARFLVTLAEVKESFEHLHQKDLASCDLLKVKRRGKELIDQFNSPTLALMGQDKLRAQKLKSSWDAIDWDNIGSLGEKGASIISDLESICRDLDNWQGSRRLVCTAPMRDYANLLKQFVDDQFTLDKTDQRLENARKEVQSATWYFNDSALSTRALERQDADEYAQWFLQAQRAWDNFESNKDGAFKVPDQPRNAVLDRTFTSQEPAFNYANFLITAFPVLAVIFLLYLAFSKQMKGMGTNALSFGKSPAKLLQRGSHRITFRDVAGIEEAKEELQEVVDFLKDPQRFTSLGAQIPKGILCVGPPGTGKTLIAKAVAGEADRPFFSISGSDFVEMFVGVGASRIRDTFEQARKHAPCIIFMDEIDAVGRHRGGGMGGGHDEREQTLNQLLVEMDGFDSNEGIILMAATNRPDVLDKALMRPGRFDRQVVIDLPDIKGRFEILKLHARKIKLREDVELMRLARATAGCSGADLKNILNEAALLAVRREQKAVRSSEVAEACDKVRFGKERRSLEISEQEKRSTAFHEAGHAVVGATLKRCDPVEKITVIPRGMSLGATYMLPTKNRLGYWREELYELLAMIMGGRCAEERFVKDISSGAKNDIERATDIARSMICEWGMSDRLGLVAVEDGDQRGYSMGMMGPSGRQISPQTAQMIDEEVLKLCTDAHRRAEQIILEKEDSVILLADMLVEFETLDSSDLEQILEKRFDVEAKRRQLLENASEEKRDQQVEKEQKKSLEDRKSDHLEPKKT